MYMNNPNLASEMRKRRAQAIARAKRKREQREYTGNISVRNIIRNLARISEEERQKAYIELKNDFPEARNKELRKDQFDKIVREEQERIREANTIEQIKIDRKSLRRAARSELLRSYTLSILPITEPKMGMR